MLSVGLRHHTVHVDDNGLAALTRRTDTTGKVQIVVGFLACFEAYGVGVENLTVDGDGTGVARYDDAVALTQVGVVVTAGVGECFVELNGYGEGSHCQQLLDVDRVIAGVALGGTQHGFHLFAFFLCHLAQQLGTLGVSALGYTASLLDNLAQALATIGQRVVTLELHLALYGDVLLLGVLRTTANVDFVIWHQCEVAAVLNLKVLVDTETVGESQCVAGFGGFGVDDASCNVDFRQRGCVGQTTSLQNGVFDCLISGILIGAGVGDLTVDGDDFVCLLFLVAGYIEYVLVLDGQVGCGALQNSFDVDADDFQ